LYVELKYFLLICIESEVDFFDCSCGRDKIYFVMIIFILSKHM